MFTIATGASNYATRHLHILDRGRERQYMLRAFATAKCKTTLCQPEVTTLKYKLQLFQENKKRNVDENLPESSLIISLGKTPWE